MHRSAILVSCMLIILDTAGCRSGPTVFIHPNADFGTIRRVAILPFETLTQDRSVADKVQKILTIEILSTGAFEVVEPGQVQKLLREQRIENPSALAPAEIKQLGSTLGVQAFFFGSVVDFGESRVGTTPAPEVTIQLRLVETQSGLTLWSASHTRSGLKLSTRLFGVGGETPTQAAQEVLRQEINTILK